MATDLPPPLPPSVPACRRGPLSGEIDLTVPYFIDVALIQGQGQRGTQRSLPGLLDVPVT